MAAAEGKFMLNFEGFQAELSTEEDFLLCLQYQKETLPNFYCRVLQMKAQPSKVSDDQVIAQAIKALRARPLHSHLVCEKLKTIAELYENFAKFSKSEVLHFRKLEQQRKSPKHGEASRPARYSDNSQCSYPKQVNTIDFHGSKPLENWEKNFGPPSQERGERIFDHRTNQYNQGGAPSRGRSRGTFKPPYCMYHVNDTNHRTKDCSIFI
jgi:hypothetical protein